MKIPNFSPLQSPLPSSVRNVLLRPAIHPRIEGEDLAGNVVEPGEERDGARRIPDRIETPESMFRADVLAAPGGKPRRHARLEKAGQHDVAADAARAILLRETLREADQPRLGRRVGALAARAVARRPRSDQQDVSALLAHHQFQRRARAEKRPAQIHVHRLFEIGSSQPRHGAVPCQSGIGDQQVEAIEPREISFDLRFVAHIHFLAPRRMHSVAGKFRLQRASEVSLSAGNQDVERRIRGHAVMLEIRAPQ